MNGRDTYGSELRDGMKRSMSEPAAFKPLNRRVRVDPVLPKIAHPSFICLFMTLWRQMGAKAIR